MTTIGTISGVVPIEKPVSRLVMGTMVCSPKNMELTNSLLDAFVEAGGNCLDTARVYGTEPAIGGWFASRGNRDEIVLIGKGAHPNAAGKRVTPVGIAEDIATSLELMQTDYIDIYLLHRDDTDVPVGEIVDSLNEHHRAGRIGIFGGSNWTTARLQAANDYARANGLEGFAASSPQLCLAEVKEPMWGGCLALDTAGKAWHTQTQMPVFPWSSQASGFFTGRFSPDDTGNADIVRVYYSEGNWERLRRAEELGAKKEATANQIALAWVLKQKFPVFPLIGPRTLEELNSSLPAVNIVLTDEEAGWLNLENG